MEFSTREGADNPGFDYEKEIAALLAVRYAFEESVSDFWIATNVDYVGDTDDIVLCITPTNGEDLALFLQLKHENPVGDAKNFKDTDFTYLMNPVRRDKKKERFSVDKYFRGYKKFQNHLKNFEQEHQDLIQHLHKLNQFSYILFSNKELDKKLNCLTDVNESVIFNNLNTSKSNYYGFKTEELNLDEDFLQNLYLFPNQINFEGVFNLIKAEIRKLFGSHKFSHVDFDDVTKKYLEIIKLWTKGCDFEKKTKYMTLSKRDIVNILSDILLETYKYDIEESRFSYYDCPQKLIWNKLMLLKNITIVYGDDLTLQFLKDYVGSEVKLCTKKEGRYWKTEVGKSVSNVFCESIPDNQVQIMKICGNTNNDSVTMVSIYKLLWFYKNVPLLLKIDDEEEYHDILKILKLSEYKLKVIVIINDQDLVCRKIKQVDHFSSLKDLEPSDKSVILNIPVQFQGRISLPLSEVARSNMLQHLRCADIIHILCNDFNIGNKGDFICKYYINRRVSKILISFDALLEIEDEFFLIEAPNKKECEIILTEILASFDLNLNNHSKLCIIESKGVSTKFEKLKMAHDCIHRLLFHEDFLEWMESTGSIENIAEFQITEDNINSNKGSYDDVSNFISSVYTNKFQIISDCSGMGKSVLLNYITCFANLRAWILPITLRNIAENDEFQEEPAKFFSFYLEQVLSEDSSVQNMEFSIMAFKDMVKSNKILLLLDGFDEISILHKDKFANLIEYFQKEKYPVLITTRETMNPFLEDKFNVLSRTLKYFTLDEQKQFLTNFFKSNVAVKNDISNAVLVDFVEQLLNAAKLNLNDHDEKFTGIPLQLHLLGNFFLKECKMSVSAKEVCLTTKFDLLDLYEKIVKNKTAILCEKYGASEKQWLKSLENNQHLFALQYLFSPIYLKELNIENRLEQYYEEEEYKAQLMQKEGILVAKPTKNKIDIYFIHSTFAEYLVAQWLTKNMRSTKLKDIVATLLNVRFDLSDQFRFLFVVFDRILAKQCTFHLDIINGKVDEIKSKLECNPNIAIETDEINRTAFHLFALYSDDYTDDDLNEIFDSNLLKNLKFDTLDNFTNYSALDFALLRKSWTFANKLCEFSQYLGIKTYDITYISIGKSLTKYKCLHLTIFHNHLCRDLLVGKVNEDTSLSYYAGKLWKNIDLSRDVVHKFLNNVSTVGEYLKYSGIQDSTKYYYHDVRFAIAYGSKENVESLLLAQEININEKDYWHEQTLLHYATIFKRSDIVKMLLNRGADINIAGKDGSTVVHEAAWYGCKDILEMYIEKAADLNRKDDSKNTPMDAAIQSRHFNISKTLLKHNVEFSNSLLNLQQIVKFGNVELLQEFFKKGFDVNQKFLNGRKLLYKALKNNRTDIAKILIHHNCDYKSEDSSDGLLHLIAKNGNVELLNLFLDSGLNIDKENKIGETPLLIAIENDHAEFVNILIAHNVDVLAKCGYRDAFFTAVVKGNTEIVSKLIEKGCDVNGRDDLGNTPLLMALQENKLNIVNVLLQENADVTVENNFGYTTLHYAAMNGYEDLVVQFLGYGVDVNKKTDDSNTALLLALDYNHVEIAKLLILSKAEVSVINKRNRNSLHYAAICGDKNLVQDLISAGAELNLQNDSGFTPLQLAISNSKPEIAQLLLSHDADITSKSDDWNSTLHLAASAGNNKIIMICLEKDFEINEQDYLGRTPLLCALECDKFETANLLIENGADITMKCRSDNSALHYAAKFGHNDFAIFLLNKGFDINEKNSLDETALNLALFNGNLSTAKLLHLKGAGIDMKRSDRSTTLHLAAACGYNELIIECIDKGYDINTRNFDSSLPIDFAILENKFETVKLLIDIGTIPSLLTFNLYLDMEVQSDLEVQEKTNYFKLLLDKFRNINLSDKDGNTILHYICNSEFINSGKNENFYQEAVEILVQLGANFETNNVDYKSAYDLAVAKKLNSVLRIFDQNLSQWRLYHIFKQK